MNERQTAALDDLHSGVVDKTLSVEDINECSHDAGRSDKSSTNEPAVYGPLANEMLSTTADYGDHESVRDCLATLADRLENLEEVVDVVYAGVESIGAKALTDSVADFRLMLEDWHEQSTIFDCLCGNNPGKVLDDIAKYLGNITYKEVADRRVAIQLADLEVVVSDTKQELLDMHTTLITNVLILRQKYKEENADGTFTGARLALNNVLDLLGWDGKVPNNFIVEQSDSDNLSDPKVSSTS